jgi:uncharacterized protein YtpQ (UPF0354 family)
MPWWLWVALGVVAVIWFLRAAMKAFRRRVRDRFVDHLRETHPELEVVKVEGDALSIRNASGQDGVMYLTTLYSMISSEGVRSPEEERRVFDRFLTAVTEHDREASQPLSLDACADRLMPRLVPKGFFDNIPPESEVPRMPVESLGLGIAYVLDGEHSVRYLTGRDLNDLGLTLEGLHQHAMANLERGFTPDMVRPVVEEKNMVMVKAGDSFDATRLLLVPRHLQPGEEIVAIVPDRDTLGLLPLPGNNDWTPLLKLARSPAGDRLILDRPVRVTQKGFQLV